MRRILKKQIKGFLQFRQKNVYPYTDVSILSALNLLAASNPLTPRASLHPLQPERGRRSEPSPPGRASASSPRYPAGVRAGRSLQPPPLPVKKEEARDMGTPEQLSSSKTQQVIPGERRRGRSARALTAENQSIVTWRGSRRLQVPCRRLGSAAAARDQKGLSAGESGDSPSRREAGAREQGGGGEGGEAGGPGEAVEGGEGWGAPGRRGPAARLLQCGFFLGSCSRSLVVCLLAR